VSQIELKQQSATAQCGSSVGFMFPGQGSQYLGMLSTISSDERVILDTFAEASEVLSFDLWSLAQDGPAESQALTANTQPLILTASVALYRLWLQRGGRVPSVVAGHSLGEFSALVAAGVLAFSDAVRIVRLRGQAMQGAVPVGEGAMAAVLGLDDEAINTICAEASVNGDTQVLAVNFNSPGQVVIAGHAAAVQSASVALKAAGAKRILPLPVSAPFHCNLMNKATGIMSEELNKLSFNQVENKLISNVTAKEILDIDELKELLVKQIENRVRWRESVINMINNDVNHFIEIGPGKVLSGLVKRINREVKIDTINNQGDIESLKI